MGLLDRNRTANPAIPPAKPTGNAAPEAAQEGDTDSTVPDGEPNVSPEEQKQYDEFVTNSLQLIYRDGQDGGEVRPEILQSLKADGPAPAASAPADPNAPPSAPDPTAPPPPAAPADPSAPPAAPAAPPPADPSAPPAAPPADTAKSGPIMALAHTAVTIVTQLDDSARKSGQPVTDDVLLHGGEAVIEELGDVARAANIYDYSPEDLTGAFQMAIDMYRPKAIQDGRTSADTLKAQFSELDQADKAGKLGDVLPGLGSKTVGEPPVQAQGQG